MKPRSLRKLFLLLITIILLTGCPNDDASSQVTSFSPKYLAIARGHVDVEGGILALHMHREGFVTNVWVKEGERVRKGQLLATLDSELAQLAVTAAHAEQKKTINKSRQLARRFKSAELKSKRLMTAVGTGASDKKSADDAHEKAQRLHDQIEYNHINFLITTQKLSAARHNLKEYSLFAPIDAVVVRRLIQPGTSVSAQAGPSFILLPNEERIVRTELNESFLKVVVPGMKAQIADDTGSGLPPLSARVRRINTVFQTSMPGGNQLVHGASMRTVECILVFDQPLPSSLRVGQRVLVRFGVGRRYKYQFNSPFPATAEYQSNPIRNSAAQSMTILEI